MLARFEEEKGLFSYVLRYTRNRKRALKRISRKYSKEGR
jgi:hypothetical protein